MLLHIPHILSPEEVQHARRLLAAAPWADGRSSAGSQARAVKNNEQLPHDCDAATEIRAMLLRGLDRNPTFFSAALPKRVYTPQLNRYQGGSNFYGNHVDNAVRFAPDTGLRVRTDISCTLFLSEPADYDGGELVVQDSAGAQRVKLPAAIWCCTRAPACTRSNLSRAAPAWPAFSGSRVWCAAASSAACCLIWT